MSRLIADTCLSEELSIGSLTAGFSVRRQHGLILNDAVVIIHRQKQRVRLALSFTLSDNDTFRKVM